MSVLIIDVGSSSVRALLLDEDLNIPPDGIAQQAYDFETGPDGRSVVDAVALREQVEGCIDAILQHPAASEIRGVGMAAFLGNLLGLDADGHPLTPVITYADTRSAADVEQLAARIDGPASHQRTGTPLHSAYHPARLHWLRRTQPEVFGRVRQWTDFATYCYRHWLGTARTSYSTASWNGLLNRRALTWDDKWLAVLGLDVDAFPSLADYDQTLQGLRAPYARRWPSLEGVPFCLAVGDGAAAAIGSGAFRPGTLSLTVGTTAAVRRVTGDDVLPVPAGLWSYRVTADQHLTGGATSEGGNLYEWARETLALPDPATIERELAARPPDGHGLTFVPLLAGERSPGWATTASGVLHGLHLGSTPLDILQAGLEAVAQRLALIAAQLSSTPDTTVIASGQAIQASPAWAGMIANALNHPLHISQTDEVTARGVAMLVWGAVAGRQWADFPTPPVRVIDPDPAAVPVMQAAAQRLQALYAQLFQT